MKHIYLILALLAVLLMPCTAKAATPDSVFVVKNGRIFSAYEVGKDVDNISFPKQQTIEGNSVKVGDETIELKSAMVMQQGGLLYAFFSPDEGCTSISDFASASAYLQVAVSPSLFGEKVEFSKLDKNSDDDMFSITYMDREKYDNDDDYEPLSFGLDDWDDYFADGTLSIEQDGDNLVLTITTEPNEGQADFGVSYNGTFYMTQQSTDYFTVDGDKKELRKVFAEPSADGITFYLTPGNIDKANDLENCYYYARLFVPTSEMDGTDIDVQGSREYDLQLVDNVSDLNRTQYFTAFNGMANNASGYVSVLDRGDGSYTIVVDVEELGRNGNTRDLQIYYKGTPDAYDTTLPSVYTVADGDDVELKSAVVTHDLNAEMYTVYLSSKENVTTVEGMADADIVLNVPEDFANDDLLHGFSGTELNGKISIAYGGDTFSQANTGNGDDAIAQGGNVKFSVSGDNASVDFSVFGITKYRGNLKGHFEGKVTRL